MTQTKSSTSCSSSVASLRGLFPHERLQSLRQAWHDVRVRQEQRHATARTRSGRNRRAARSGRASLLLGYHPTVGAILLVIFLLGVSFPIHNFWAVQEPQAKMTEMVNFMKNMALLGFVLMTVAIPRPWPMSLGH